MRPKTPATTRTSAAPLPAPRFTTERVRELRRNVLRLAEDCAELSGQHTAREAEAYHDAREAVETARAELYAYVLRGIAAGPAFVSDSLAAELALGDHDDGEGLL
jgi:hypothetical protein